jgi:hypothetical protein
VRNVTRRFAMCCPLVQRQGFCQLVCQVLFLFAHHVRARRPACCGRYGAAEFNCCEEASGAWIYQVEYVLTRACFRRYRKVTK